MQQYNVVFNPSGRPGERAVNLKAAAQASTLPLRLTGYGTRTPPEPSTHGARPVGPLGHVEHADLKTTSVFPPARAGAAGGHHLNTKFLRCIDGS
jgi:hypothetical protein